MVLEVQAVTNSLVGTGLGLSQACQPTVGSQDKDAYAGSETQNSSVINKRGVCRVPTHQSKLLSDWDGVSQCQGPRLLYYWPLPSST